MSDRDIRCKKCNSYLGTIRDAKLRKDIVYYCALCDGANAFASNNRKGSKDNFSDLFADILGGKK